MFVPNVPLTPPSSPDTVSVAATLSEAESYQLARLCAALTDQLIPNRAASWDPDLSWGFRREELDEVPPSEGDWTLRYCLSELFEPVANEPALTVAELRSRLYASLSTLMIQSSPGASHPSGPLFETYIKVELAKHLARNGALKDVPREAWKSVCEQYAVDIAASRISFPNALQDAGTLTRSVHAEHSFMQANHRQRTRDRFVDGLGALVRNLYGRGGVSAPTARTDGLLSALTRQSRGRYSSSVEDAIGAEPTLSVVARQLYRYARADEIARMVPNGRDDAPSFCERRQ